MEPYRPFPTFEEWVSDAIDVSLVDRFAAQLAAVRTEAEPETLREAVNIATRWAAVNTGAIEGLFEVDRGFTYSVAASSVMWQDVKNLKGEFAADSIADAMKAYDFVLDAATRSHPVSETWIRELHQIVTKSQDTYTVITAVGRQEQDLPKGVYKTYPNNPLHFASKTVHSYAPPSDTSPEMARLVDQIRSDRFEKAPSVLQAAYAHYAFVCVHPFADGNGRVARALASTFLYRGIGVPLVIFADQKASYLDGLEAADRGTYSSITHFFAERVIDTIGMVREAVLTAALPDLKTQLEELRPLLSGNGGLPHSEIDAITIRVGEVFLAAVQKVILENPLDDPLAAKVTRWASGPTPIPDTYRTAPGDRSAIAFSVSSAAPATAEFSEIYGPITRLPSADGEDFMVIASGGRTVMGGYLREVHPTISAAFTFRAEAAAQRELRHLVAVTAERAARRLRDRGYV